MSERVLDYNRGVLINLHQGLNMEIFMYVDEPGIYLTAHGTRVSDELARQAGYPVDLHSKEKNRRERMAAAKQAIEAELGVADGGTKTVRAERDGFKVLDIGLGRFDVLDPDGNILHPGQHLPENVALMVLDQMAPAKAAVVAEKRAAKTKAEPAA